MNGLVLFIFIVGAASGYALCRIQLRGRFVLAQEAIDDAEADMRAARWRVAHPLPTYDRDPDPQPQLIRTPRCPGGYGAAQILGYNDFGIRHPSLYPGGKEKYLEEN